jgi:uncharacterized protein (DUF952 family)
VAAGVAEMRVTYHLLPLARWDAVDAADPLGAPSLETEGFVHCTDGAANMVATANRHYSAEPGSFVVLSVDLDRITSAWRVDDPERIYPHIFGPIDRAAIIGVAAMPRDDRGTFLPFEA